MSPLLTQRRVLAAAHEATIGTAESLSASEAAFNVFDAEINPSIDMSDRPAQGSFSNLTSIPQDYGAEVSFAVEVHGSGTEESTGGESVPEWAKNFLPACGLTTDPTSPEFTLSSAPPTGGSDQSAVRTLTIGVYEDGVLKTIKGAMGTATFNFTAGQLARVEFTFTGVWDGHKDEALVDPDYPTVQPPRWDQGSLTVGSWNPTVETLSVDLGNNVVLRQDATSDSGLISALITNREVTGSLNPEAELVADHDVYGDWKNVNTAALSLTIGDTGDGNTMNIDAPAFQVTSVSEGDRNGIQTDDVSFAARRSSADDDELTITFE